MESTRRTLPEDQFVARCDGGDPQIAVRILEDAENLLLAERVAIIDQRGCAPVQVPRARRFEKTIQPFLCLEPPFTVVCLKRNLIPSPTPTVKSRIAKEVDSIEAVEIGRAHV